MVLKSWCSTTISPILLKFAKMMINGLGMEKGKLLERGDEGNCDEDQRSQTEYDDHVDLLDEEFYRSREFWMMVHEKQSKGLPWNRAMDEVRVERLIQNYKVNGELNGEDPALVMLKHWPASKQYKDKPDKLPGLEKLVNQFLEIMLDSELNSGNRYELFQDEEDETKKTLLHYSSEAGFLQITKTLLKKCPGLLEATTELQIKPKGKRAMLAVELALNAENDDVAAYLVRAMWHKSVTSLFSWRPEDMSNPQPSLFSFQAIVENPKMKKTVVALLDQMVNPHWPYLPKRKDTYVSQEEKKGIEGVWKTIPEDPLNYYFHYAILDGDGGGRPPKLKLSEGHTESDNKYFNQRDKSCLNMIAKSKNKEALQHPVVRMLVKTKWKSYGHFFLRQIPFTFLMMFVSLQTVLYAIFLLFLSFSLLYGSTKPDPTQYRGAADLWCGFCEIVTLLMAVFYMCEELNQLRIGFGDVLLSGVRALSEQRPFVADFSSFNWLSMLLMLMYMGTVLVILLNILIAQMSTTYIQAKKVARLEYDVDRILHLTRMERFPFLNLRVKYYKEGEWISEKKLAEELLEFSEDRNPWESVEEKLNAISLQAALYVIFLLLLSYSLLYGSTKQDPTQYRGVADMLCGFCEIATLLMVFIYMCEEMNQMRM
ncbi:hypothetical protein AWC38_SpisGene20897 [Stylophora pistillata]|uniref:Uncharacterized protein n=1 Tax=Stylophora pistillata TaxID=50429 RepID=A0A2B4RDM0_STYPI|nr:hypothetical protein AWC38_SpisGene20897 [Stylophora pistillata]